ncbi:MAG: N-6 DNA methylase [Thermus sp.]|nr:N-6 DNA methylase [Thermus sp.]
MAASTVAKREGDRAVRSVGGLFGPDFLEKLDRGEVEGQKPASFGLKGSLQETIAQSYETARLYYQAFKARLENLPAGASEVSITREGFVIPFLSLLGYELYYQREWPEAAGRKWPISHRADPDPESPPVLVVGYNTSLTKAEPSLGHRSPHGLMQDYLNASGHLWGLVTNGRSLRVLRQTPFLRRQAYLEADLEAILEGDGQADFGILFRLVHRTRFPRVRSEAQDSLLERYYQQALEQGERAKEKLRVGVEKFLQDLGTGLLRSSSHEAVKQAKEDPQGFYRDLLRLTYRLLFLLVAEARGVLGGNRVYQEGYSLARLISLVNVREAYTEDFDLWFGLRTLFRLLRDPEPIPELDGEPLARALGLTVLNGRLFDPISLDQEDYRITNRDFLEAFRHLVYYQDEEGFTRRVNYAALDVEELGSIYESLLDNHPVVDQKPLQFHFVRGDERKGTGSYYTPDSLVDLVLKQALDPVVEERLKGAGPDPEAQEKALLSLKVLDPAAGSGHFLLGAARRMARRLAQVRTGEEEPSPQAYRQAVRDVVTHCIYGVDKNPLAVELCRVALWMESHAPGTPLAFLDHRIRHGDSLLGLMDLEALRKGIPEGAFAPREKPWEGLKTLKARKKRESTGHTTVIDGLGKKAQSLETLEDDTLAGVRAKERAYQAFQEDPERQRQLDACHLWTAAFFQPLPPTDPDALITTSTVFACLEGNPKAQALELARRLAAQHAFFHWPLEFPEVFAQGGFDVVMGNPPWERIKLQEQEFFAARDPEIANAPNAAARKRLIAQLPEKNPELWREYQEALHTVESTSRFLRESGFYPLTGRGHINTYSVFAERMRALLKPGGRMGIIVPTGIATDDTNKHFFNEVVERGELLSLFDFDNREKLFPAVASAMKFSVFVLRKLDDRRMSRPAEFAFFLHNPKELEDPERRLTLTPEDFRLLNPNTKTTPIFRSRKDAELTKHIYRRVPVLVEEAKGEAGNPWGVRFSQGLFNMTTDSHLFRTQEELLGEGYRLEGNVFVRGGKRYLPLYEAKMVHQFNHRFGDYAMQKKGSKSTQLPEIPLERLADPHYQVLPRYWVPEGEVEARLLAKGWDRGWLLGWRDIARSTDERTVIATVIPRVGVGNKYPLIVGKGTALFHLGAVLSCIALDFAARQKVGGTSLNFFILEQLPVLPPSAFEKPLPFTWGFEGLPLPPESSPPTVADFVRPRLLELVYTAWEMRPFAQDLGYDGPPFPYDLERRFRLRAELDALFFHLYLGTPEEWEKEASPELKALFPTPQDAISYILDQFPILKRREEETYGEYRTKKAILQLYETFLTRLP